MRTNDSRIYQDAATLRSIVDQLEEEPSTELHGHQAPGARHEESGQAHGRVDLKDVEKLEEL